MGPALWITEKVKTSFLRVNEGGKTVSQTLLQNSPPPPAELNHQGSFFYGLGR